MKSLAAQFKMIPAARVSNLSSTIYRIETAGSDIKSAVPARRRILLGHQFDYSAKLAAVFRGITCRHHAHGFDITGVESGRKSGRTVLCYWHSVQNILDLIFGATRMKNSIRFIKPAGLIVYSVRQIPSCLCRPVFAQGFRADVEHCANFRRVKNCRGVRDLDLGIDCRRSEEHTSE